MADHGQRRRPQGRLGLLRDSACLLNRGSAGCLWGILVRPVAHETVTCLRVDDGLRMVGCHPRTPYLAFTRPRQS